MAYDLLIIASDESFSNDFDHLDFAALDGKYGMSREDWSDMIEAKAPLWAVDGTTMVFPAVEHFFKNGRQLALTEARKREYYAEKRRGELRYLNGIFLADYCTRHGFSVEVINALSGDSSLLDDMLARGPRAVAISSTFIPDRCRIIEIARAVKRRDADVHVIVGGPLIRYSHMVFEERPDLAADPMSDTLYFFGSSDVQESPAIDALVVDARGEETLVKVLERIKTGRSYHDVPNIAHYDENTRRPTLSQLTPESPGVEGWRIDWENLDDRFLGPSIAVRGSIGCPYRCKFCSFVVLYPEWELKSIEFMERELRSIATRSAVKHVAFSDDNLFLQRKEVDRYARMMADAKLPFTWSGYVRADSVTEENADWLADSGCTGIALGIESGDASMLKTMLKVQKPDRILGAVERVNRRGISTASSFIIGFPGETEETVSNTIDFLNAMPESDDALNWYTVWPHAVVPLTPADKERERWSLNGYWWDWEHATMNIGEAHRQVKRVHREVHRGAYLSYPLDDASVFERPNGGADHLGALKARHGLGVLDETRAPTYGGATREELLERLKDAVLGK